jgi:uncharacterized protein (TIGR00252 family)
LERTADDRRAALVRGAEAETLVARELELQGWTVLARNWRGAGGEIDLVAIRAGVLRFVEVKARDPEDLGSGVEALTDAKQKKLVRAAEEWLSLHEEPVEAAFLVALVSFGEGGRWSIEWIDDAFDG